jgi:hypothetical protein
MIRTADVMARVRSQCPGFATVDHALSSNAEFAYPAALVSPVMVNSNPARLLTVHSQIERVTFGVFIILERRQDALGTSAADQLDDLRVSLRAALAGWQAPGATLPFDAAGGRLDQWRPGIAGWREDFSAETELRF